MAKTTIINLDGLVDGIVTSNVNVVAANEAVVEATDKASEATVMANEADNARVLAVSEAEKSASSASEAEGYKDEAAASASTAGMQAGLAEDKANEAALEAEEAKLARNIAENYRDDALNYLAAVNVKYDEFDDRWLGVKASDPTIDNDGYPLIEGALYWNNTTSELRIYAPTLGGWVVGTISAEVLAAVEKVQDSLPVITAVADDMSNVNVVATNIGSVNSVSTSMTELLEVHTNLAEVLAADDNAAIATLKASEAQTYAEAANVDKMVWKGKWSSGTYEKNDVVRYGTHNYIVVVDTTNEEPSVGVDWEISMKGAVPAYTFIQDGTELVISTDSYIQYPVTYEEW